MELFLLRVGLMSCSMALLGVAIAVAQDGLKTAPLRTPANKRAVTSDRELSQSRAEVLQKMKETRAGAERLLALHEAERARALEEYNRRRESYYQGLVSRNEVLQAEHAVIESMARVAEDKRWILETDTALTEYSMRDELLRLPALAVGGYAESGKLLRFNGGPLWSLDE